MTLFFDLDPIEKYFLFIFNQTRPFLSQVLEIIGLNYGKKRTDL